VDTSNPKSIKIIAVNNNNTPSDTNLIPVILSADPASNPYRYFYYAILAVGIVLIAFLLISRIKRSTPPANEKKPGSS